MSVLGIFVLNYHLNVYFSNWNLISKHIFPSHGKHIILARYLEIHREKKKHEKAKQWK